MRSSVRLHHDWISCQTVNICAGWLVHVIPVFTLFTYPGEGESSLQEINNWKHWRNCQFLSDVKMSNLHSLRFGNKSFKGLTAIKVSPCVAMQWFVMFNLSMSFHVLPWEAPHGLVHFGQAKAFWQCQAISTDCESKGFNSSPKWSNDIGLIWFDCGWIVGSWKLSLDNSQTAKTRVWRPFGWGIWPTVWAALLPWVWWPRCIQEVEDRSRLPMNTEIRVIAIMMKWR